MGKKRTEINKELDRMDMSAFQHDLETFVREVQEKGDLQQAELKVMVNGKEMLFEIETMEELLQLMRLNFDK
ncbi:MAG: hypothetical protein PHX58_08345 [Desulfovibrio sp.]|jgi:hypothetical protein|nr:hypothetical protein [Desulfovibrio sp.]